MTNEVDNISLIKRREIIDALRRGTVPKRGLEVFAVGLDRFEVAIDAELESAASGNGVFKAVRGEYGTGKTFFSRWLEHRARERGFATALVQISEVDTPLYRFETIYRRALESLQTREWSQGAFRQLIDKWFFELEEEAIALLGGDSEDAERLASAVGDLLEKRLATVSATHPQFAAALRAAHTARLRDEHAISEGLLAWLMGQPNVGSPIKRAANLKGDLDHRGASGFFRGLLAVLRQLGRRGLVLVLDEVETIQRVRTDSREKSLNALRQLIDDIDAGSFPGLYVLMTGTPQFFDGPQGVKRLAALDQRLHVDFGAVDARFDNPRAVQIRLTAFDRDRLLEVGRRIRSVYPTEHAERIAARVGDDVLELLADGISGKLGGKVGIPPRIFLRKLVSEILDRVDQFPEFDPKLHYSVTVQAAELSDEERAATGMARSIDDIELDLGAD
ncbi:putative ATP/GTP binding protein [Enhygromyxa salina]|uniref:Putative ATP/GTP binding protein n=1 Tax=Enhygromyxa salina TaxID=215803 RepID=A0A0C1ZJV3_9BACT|nr:BREX system ATP-binding protein BrxD [Enhygromyxa salina]KIG17734.1 putative ATP/GTP binding protein [Enhygromyxa salina]